MSLLTDGIEHSIATALPVLRASQSMVPWICQHLDVARVCSKPYTACLPHQTGITDLTLANLSVLSKLLLSAR